MDHNQTHAGDQSGREAASSTASEVVMVVVKQEDAALEEDEGVPCTQDMAESQWNQEEHARFVQALETYGGEHSGDEWRKITAVVHTRSMNEVRLHGRRYLQHLMHLHELQQQQTHATQQQQSRLLQLSRMGRSPLLVDPLQYPLTASREIQNNQNDLNGLNNSKRVEESGSSKAATSKVEPTPSPLSAAAMSVANTMDAHTLPSQGDAQPVMTAKKPSTSTTGGRKPKVWSFQEDKVLELALASWQSSKPYSWPKIAANLPGKTAKDVRLRYEQLVDDVSRIETVGGLQHIPQPPSSSLSTAATTTTTTATSACRPPKAPAPTTTTRVGNPYARPPPHAGLSSRIAPPPPIQVPPLSSKGKATSSLLDSPGIFPGTTRGRFVMTPSFGSGSGMLSPTFLDFLASEDKQPLPLSALNDLPSPLGLEMSSSSKSSAREWSNRSRATPTGLTTPRIWREFLSEDLKLDAQAAGTPPSQRDCGKREEPPLSSERRMYDLETEASST